jgi:PAS domain S-box-containing protein
MPTNLPHSELILLTLFAALILGACVFVVMRTRPGATKSDDVALSDAQTRMALALQGSNDGLWHWDMRSSVVHLSPRAYELLGRRPGDFELHIRAVRELAHPEDVRQVLLALKKHLRKATPYRCECRFRLKSGEYRWFGLRGQVDRDGAGTPLQMAGSITDITEQRLAEAAIGRHALQQGLISELGQFALESPEIAELISEAISVVRRGVTCEFSRLLLAGRDDWFLELKGGTGWSLQWMSGWLYDPVEETEDRFIIGVRDAVIIDDFERERRYRPSEMLRAHGIRSGAEVLVCGVRDSFGVLGIYSRRAKQFTLEDVGFLRGVSNILAASLDRNLAQELLTAQEVKSRESEERLRQIADSLPAMIAYWDNSGVCRFANEAHLGQIGIASQDMVGKSFGDVFGAAYGVAKLAHEAVLKGERQLFDMSAKLADGAARHWQGEFLPHWARSEVIGFYALTVDITERKTAEERLARQEALLAATGRMGEIGGWEIELDDLVPRLSEMACRIHDLPPGSSLNQESAAAFYSAESWRVVRRAVNEAFQLHKPFDYIVPFVTAKGRHRWVRSIGEPQLTNGRCTRVVCAIQDVTQQKNLEAELAQSQKLESIGQLAAGIAHEINTPTQFIGNNVSFIQEVVSELFGAVSKIKEASEAGPAMVPAAQIKEVLDNVDLAYLLEEVPRAIQESRDGIERIQKIVGAMKEFSHPAMDKSPVDINRAIGSTITVASNEWKYVAEIKTDLDENLPAVPVMPGSFNQVILNIIVNAAHAVDEMVQGGSRGKGIISISTRQVGNWAEIRIQDTGCGMPDKIRERIFDPFFTTKPVGKGTGQGLAIAHDVIVKKHGGAIAVESAPGAGTTFILRLPLLAQSSEEVAAA